MSGEMKAVLKIVEGVKELGKALLPDEVEPRAARPQAKQEDTWARATARTEPGVYAIPTVLVDELFDAVDDPEVAALIPYGVMIKIVRMRELLKK